MALGVVVASSILGVQGEARARPLDATQVKDTLAALSGSDPDASDAALTRVVEAGDARFAPVLVELLRAEQLGIAPGVEAPALGRALETLTGAGLGTAATPSTPSTPSTDWARWVTWLAGSDLRPPPGFTGWKGRLLSRIDPRFGPLLAEGIPVRIRSEEIVWGGVAFEGIPALDQPATQTAAEASDLLPDEPVFGVVVAGEARAYPLRILDWHEMANDVVGGVPISLAYCTLCGSGVAYETRASDGVTYDFGSSGLLVRSNKLMVDRQTHSLWNQFTGVPVVGPLASAQPAGEGLRLKPLPSVVTTWNAWKQRHPDTRVLSVATGYSRPYHPGAAYADYFASEDTMFPVRAPEDGLAAKARVLGIRADGAARAFPIETLLGRGVVNDTVGSTPIVLIAEGESIDVDGLSVRSGIRRSYSAGGAVRAYRRGQRVFERAGVDSSGVVDQAGARWTVEEGALVGPDGVRLERIAGQHAFWFAWWGFEPATTLFK